MQFTWDFFPKWTVRLENGLIIPENRLVWAKLPIICAEQDSVIESIELDLGCGIKQILPRAKAYYCAYRLYVDLSCAKHKEMKIIGWGDRVVKATVYTDLGDYFYEDIDNPQEPFLLKVK